MNPYLEFFGYIGTALVVVSMMMTSVTRLRVLNICGSVIGAIYALIGGVYPMALMNICLIGINLYRLVRDGRGGAEQSRKEN
jgi:hypothetical protein